MKVTAYFYKEPDIQSVILRNNKIRRQALDTVYDFVWDGNLNLRILSMCVRFVNLFCKKSLFFRECPLNLKDGEKAIGFIE